MKKVVCIIQSKHIKMFKIVFKNCIIGASSMINDMIECKLITLTQLVYEKI